VSESEAEVVQYMHEIDKWHTINIHKVAVAR